MRALRISLVVVSIVWTSAASASAQCDLLSWCPFGCHSCRAGASTPITQVSDNGAGQQSPAMLTKMSSGTRRFMSGTMNLLSFKKPDATPAQANYVRRSTAKKPGFFYRLFHPEPPPPPRTIEEWMSLEQIHP